MDARASPGATPRPAGRRTRAARRPTRGHLGPPQHTRPRLAAGMRGFIAARDWLTIYQPPSYAPDLNPGGGRLVLGAAGTRQHRLRRPRSTAPPSSAEPRGKSGTAPP